MERATFREKRSPDPSSFLFTLFIRIVNYQNEKTTKLNETSVPFQGVPCQEMLV